MTDHKITVADGKFHPEQHLWPRIAVNNADDCWEWTGYRLPSGYGQSSVSGVLFYAHRAAWEHVKGPIPPGLFVCHRCDNPPCCNPAHLFLGTHRDNMADMSAKGRKTGSRSKLKNVPKFRGERNPKAKLSWLAVSDIRTQRNAGKKLAELALAFGVDQSTISKVVNNHIWFP